MQNRKKDMIQFGVWMRNGIAFCTTWFLLLLLAYHHIFKIQTISIHHLTQLVLWIVGGVFLFNLFFTRFIIIKWSFIRRLSGFMIAISLYECLSFYWLDFFKGRGTVREWLVFIGIVFTLYLCCIAIYQRYSKKQGEIYTQALQEYQRKRSMEDGE